VPKDICYERIPGQGRSAICDASKSATQGGGVCNLVAQAFLKAEKTSDVAIQNGGGCRSDIAQGNFTIADAWNVLPFSNTLVTLELTGAQIKVVLEEALVYTTEESGSTGAYPYAAGLRFDVNYNNGAGNRISGLEVNSRLEAEWSLVIPAKTYTVVSNSFIAEGRDGYLEFGNIATELKKNTYLEYANSFVKFAKAKGVLSDPDLSQYSTKSIQGFAQQFPYLG